MGTWGTGPFDNDYAADFAGDLDEAAEAERPSLIREALAVVAHGDAQDGHRGDIAVAAAALVAVQCPGGEPSDPIYGPEEPLPPLPEDLRPLAVAALDRVTGHDSELRKLWGDDDSAREWLAGIGRLRVVLSAGDR
jgi:hypothetical protein